MTLKWMDTGRFIAETFLLFPRLLQGAIQKIPFHYAWLPTLKFPQFCKETPSQWVATEGHFSIRLYSAYEHSACLLPLQFCHDNWYLCGLHSSQLLGYLRSIGLLFPVKTVYITLPFSACLVAAHVELLMTLAEHAYLITVLPKGSERFFLDLDMMHS
jgi:hypothetical protein